MENWKNDEKNVILRKAVDFAIRIVKLHRHLNTRHKIFSLFDQVLRVGTSIGANVVEAQDAQSEKDFTHKMSIALKEARETRYWIYLLIESEYLEKNTPHLVTLGKELDELLRLLTSIVKTSRRKLQ